MGRTQDRRSFAEDVRIALLEQDADALTRAVERVEGALERGFEKVKSGVKEDLDGFRNTQRWFIGVAVSILIALISALAILAFK